VCPSLIENKFLGTDRVGDWDAYVEIAVKCVAGNVTTSICLWICWTYDTVLTGLTLWVLQNREFPELL
jgi:hypothetical protein